MIDVVVDEGDRVVVNTSDEVLCIESRSDLTIVFLTEVMISRLVVGMINVDVNMLSELNMVIVVVMVITLEVFLMLSCLVNVLWTGTGINIGETIAMRVGVMVTVLIDLLTDTMVGIVNGIGVDVLTDVNSTPLTATMTGLDLTAMAESSADSLFFFSTALSRWPIAALDCRTLQTRMPSYHVCSTFALSAPPQLPNQEPPRPQQLILPDFGVVPHLTHMELTVFIMGAEYSHVENR